MAPSDDKPLSIAVVDDHRLFLMGFSHLLDRIDRSISVATFESPIEMIEQLDAGMQFDLIICDLLMSRMNGLAFVDAIRAEHQVPVLILSGTSSPPPIAEMQRLGVVGFLHKSVEPSVMQEAINTVLSGKTYFPHAGDLGEPRMALDYGKQIDLAGEPKDVPKLSPRQVEVLQHISSGAANSEIASALGISENTVKSHLKQIFQSLKVTKRTACVRVARSLGII